MRLVAAQIPRQSHWSEQNQLPRQGKVTIRRMAGLGHTGRGGYIDAKTTGADGRSYAEEKAQVIVEIWDPGVLSLLSIGMSSATL